MQKNLQTEVEVRGHAGTEEGPNERAAADLGIKTSSQTDTKSPNFEGFMALWAK